SSAMQDVQTSIAASTQLEQVIAIQQTKVAEVEKRRGDQVQQVLVAQGRLTAMENDIQQRHSASGIVALSGQTQTLSEQEQRELVKAMHAAFPTAHDSERGAVISFNDIPSSEQMATLGRLLASVGFTVLVEVEVYVSGSNSRSAQLAAEKSAEELRRSLIQQT